MSTPVFKLARDVRAHSSSALRIARYNKLSELIGQLLNPAHADAVQCKVVQMIAAPLDPRLYSRLG